MTDKDFPAAHSMDTQWFAVDKHGRVAVFETGEAGALPNEAADAELYIGGDAPPDGLEIDVDDMMDKADGKVFCYVWRTRNFEEFAPDKLEIVYSSLLWLKDESLLEPSRSSWWSRLMGKRQPTFTRIQHPKYVLAVVDELSKDQFAGLLSAGEILRAWLGCSIEPHRYGFFQYEHGDEFENWISGPYVRRGAPKHELTIDELPDAIRDKVGKFRMANADFRRDRVIQPQEEYECSSWGETWVDLNGEIHGTSEE